jgi:hypothetical protein
MQPAAVPLATQAPAPSPGEAHVGVVGQLVQPPANSIGVDWTVLVPIIGTALGLLITTTLNAFLSYHNGKKADAIHVLVNSGMTKALSDNAAQAEEIRVLRSLVQALNDRIGAMPEGESAPSRADVAHAHLVVDAGRLPSAEVIAAQGATPQGKPPSG